jgi:type II restriction enzyme
MMRVKLPDGRRRRLLLREAARLQSFPDWFKFVGNESSQFNQIGNAVPPLFAYHIAESILNYLKKDFRYSLEEIRKLNKKAVRLKQDDLPFSGSPNVKLKSPIVSKESNIMENVRFKYLLTKTEAVASNVKQMSYKTFDKKAPELRELINDTLYLLEKLGVPVMEKSPRHREMMALSFLAICNVKKKVDWSNAKCLSDNYALSTREIIAYINANFSEDVSSGSYDDIRRKHLLHPRLAGIVVPSKEDAATNDPQRKWGLNKEYSNIIKTFDQPEWEKSVEEFLKGKELLIEQLYQERQIRKIPVNLPGEVKIELEAGSHNLIQKAIIEEFLPRFGAGAEIVYVGDANNKRLYYDAEKADNLSLGKLQHEELPDVIAYSKDKNWLFLIEAVHSANPISSERIVMLKNFLKNCTADVIYVTAFKDREVMKNFIFDIAWETEVWIASDPDHMIHFDGEKFLGPFKNP